MPYKDKQDQYACNRRYYKRNAEQLKRKRREKYQCLIKIQLKKKKIN